MLSHALRLGALALAITLSSPASAIEGTYQVKGKNASDQSGNYTAVARIQKTGDTFSILFKSGEVGYIGTGIVVKEILSVVFQPLVPNASAAVASYMIVNNQIVGGTWSLLGSKSIGVEQWSLNGGT